ACGPDDRRRRSRNGLRDLSSPALHAPDAADVPRTRARPAARGEGDARHGRSSASDGERSARQRRRRRSAMTAPIRTAVIGYGLGGETFHAPLVAATRGLELSAIVTRDEGRRDRARAAYPDVKLVADVEEVLSPSANIGLVVITTPNSTHAPIARGTIDAGIPCVVDKPFAATADEAREIERRATEKN